MAADQIQIFLSYARDDDESTPGSDYELGFVSALHERLEHELKKQGQPRPRIWRDQEQIEKGENFDVSIATAIQQSEFFMVVLSRNWPTRPECLRELELFSAHCERRNWPVRERIIVVRTQLVAEAECPSLFQRTGRTEGYNYFHFRSNVAREAGFELPIWSRGRARHELYDHRCSELGGYLWRAGRRLLVLVFVAAHCLADPIGRPARRHCKADFKQCGKNFGGAVMRAVFVADDAADRDLAIRRHSAALILLIEESVHAFKDTL